MKKSFLYIIFMTTLISSNILKSATCNDCAIFVKDLGLDDCSEFLINLENSCSKEPIIDLPFDHICNPATLPTKIPTNLQEKLAWGLLKLDRQVVLEALDAGANPNMNLNHFIVDSYQGWISGYALVARALPLSFEKQEEPDDASVATVVEYYQKIVPFWEILITRGASVDMDAQKSKGVKCLRTFIKDIIDGPPSSTDIPCMKNLHSNLLPIFKNLQALIDKYQPEKQSS